MVEKSTRKCRFSFQDGRYPSGRFGWAYLALLAGVLAVSVACGPPPTQSEEGKSQTSAGATGAEKTEGAKPTPSADPQETVATLDGEKLTRLALEWFAQGAQAPGVAPGDALAKPLADLRTVVEDYATMRVAARHFDELGLTLSSSTLQRNAAQDKGLLLDLLYQKEIAAKTPPPTEADIQDYYDKNSQAFVPPFSFDMRHIFISNYVPVETTSSDTLESLARRISGDPAMVDFILIDNDAKAPRAPGYSKGDRATIKPLEAGELLLVPAAAEQKKKNLEKIQAAKRRIDAGESFIDVAKDVSESAQKGDLVPGVGQSGRPVLPQFVEQARKTDVGKTTDVFETKHGCNLMLIEAKTGDQPLPLDDAMKKRIAAYVAGIKKRDTTRKFVDGAFSTETLKVDYALFKNPDTPSTVPVVTVGDKTFSRGDLRIPAFGEPSEKMTDKDVDTYLKASAILRDELLVARARNDRLEETPRFKIVSRARTNQAKRQAYLTRLRREIETATVDEAEAKAFFAANPSEFTRPPSYTYHLLAMRIQAGPPSQPAPTTQTLAQEDPENATPTPEPESSEVEKTFGEVSNLIRGVSDLDAFKAIIVEHSDMPGAAGNAGLIENAPEKKIGPELLKEIQATAPGHVTRPVREGNMVVVAWVLSRNEGGIPTYEEVEAQLPGLVRTVRLKGYPKDQLAEMLKEIDIVWP